MSHLPLYICCTADAVTPDFGDTFIDLCVEGYSSASLPCFTTNLLAAWDFNAANLAAEPNDASVLATLNSFYTSNQLEGQLGNEDFSDATQTSVASAQAIKFVYYLKDNTEVINNEYVTERNDAWELEFLNSVQDFRSDHVGVYASATRSFSDEFGAVILGDVGLINAAYFIMIIYLSVNLGKLPCRSVCPNPGSRVGLALSSVLSILLAMGASFGMCAGMGFIWSPVHSVLPFVILGLGVDDSFVITSCFDHTSASDPIPVRMKSALAHAATSITVTSLTDFVAFAISTTSALPALSSFCMYAAMCILFLFILQITFFTAAVCLDAERQAKHRLDCCPCCTDACVRTCVGLPCCNPLSDAEKQEVEEGHKQGALSKFMEHKYAPVLLSKPGKAGVLAAFTALLVICCTAGIPNLRVEDNARSFVPDGSYLLDTLGRNDKYFSDGGVTLYVVTQEMDYFAAQSSIGAIDADVEALSPGTLQSPSDSPETFDSWYDAYKTYCAANSVTTYTSNEAVFYSTLHDFLNSAAGAFYNSSIVFDGPRNIVATRISTEFKVMSKYYDGALQQNTDEVVAAMDRVRKVTWSAEPAFPWSYDFLTWETFKIIQEELYQNVILCLVAVFIITTLLIGHPGCSGLVFIAVVMTVLDILGCMYFWGIFIDNGAQLFVH